MKPVFLFAILVSGYCSLAGQPSLLERRITLTLDGETIETSLRKIAEAGSFVFSYNPSILEAGKQVHRHFVDRTVREVLDILFEGTLRYKVRGNYIILTKATSRRAAPEPAVITGYVVDEQTGNRLENVSVYDPVTLSSALTDSEGYFQVTIERPAAEVILAVNRMHYRDTVVVVPRRNKLLNIPIRLNTQVITAAADSLENKVQQLWRRRGGRTNDRAVPDTGDTLLRIAQISLIPFVGTNGKVSDQVINQYSFNVLGGHALGLQKVEIGGLFNMERGSVNGVQFAGLYNGVAGGARGVQLAGLANASKMPVTGVQFAGVANVGVDTVSGAQVAGMANVANGPLCGVQLAGALNLSTDDNRGAQLSGAINLAVRDVEGLQLGGLMNIALKRFQGVQIAGFLNYARTSEGVQIAPFNVADSATGIPFGFMSFIRKGYHKVEVSVDEIFYNNLSFRTGVRQFYNILTVGAKPSTYEEAETFWSFGYGFGTAPRLAGRKLFLNVDLTSNQVVYGNRIEALDLLNKLYLGVDYQLLKKVSLAAGATWNVHVTQAAREDYPGIFTDYQPHLFFDRIGDHHRVKMWIGGKVALRFF